MTPPSSLTWVRAAQELQLPYGDIEQDRGIANADATRLPAFVAYYVQHAPLFDDWGVEHDLGELLLESANDASRDGVGERRHVEAAVQAVVSRQHTEPTQFLLEYWTRLGLPREDDLGEPEWYPVAHLLIQAVAAPPTDSEGHSRKPGS